MTRVVVVADSGPALASLTAAVGTVPGAYIVRHGSSAGRLDRLVAPLAPDLVADRRPARPRRTRSRASPRCARAAPDAKVVVLSSSPEAGWLADALRAKASAVLPGQPRAAHARRSCCARCSPSATPPSSTSCAARLVRAADRRGRRHEPAPDDRRRRPAVRLRAAPRAPRDRGAFDVLDGYAEGRAPCGDDRRGAPPRRRASSTRCASREATLARIGEVRAALPAAKIVAARRTRWSPAWLAEAAGAGADAAIAKTVPAGAVSARSCARSRPATCSTPSTAPRAPLRRGRAPAPAMLPRSPSASSRSCASSPPARRTAGSPRSSGSPSRRSSSTSRRSTGSSACPTGRRRATTPTSTGSSRPHPRNRRRRLSQHGCTNRTNMEGKHPHMINAFRARADELGTTRLAGRFRPDTNLAEGADRDRLVAQAVARAKAGDQEALRFLYVQLRRQRLRLRAQHRPRRLRGRGRHAARLREADDRSCRSTSSAPCRSPPGSSASRATSRSTTCASAARSPARRSASSTSASDHGDAQQTSIAPARGARDAARGAARGHRAAPPRRASPPARSPAGSARPSRRSTACTTAAAARSAPRWPSASARRRCASKVAA